MTDLRSPIYRAVCIAHPVLNPASTHRSGFVDFFSSLPSFFSSSKFFFVLFIQSERCTLDRPARFLSSVLASFRNQHSPLCTTVHRLYINGNALQHCFEKKFFLLASSRKRRWVPRVTFCYSVGYQPPGIYKGFMQGASLEAIRPVISQTITDNKLFSLIYKQYKQGIKIAYE